MNFTLEQIIYLQKHGGQLKDLTGLIRYLKHEDHKKTKVKLQPHNFKHS